MVRPTDDHSAARALQRAAARRAASREESRGSGGPANGRASAAVVSWAAGPLFAPPGFSKSDSAKWRPLNRRPRVRLAGLRWIRENDVDDVFIHVCEQFQTILTY